MSSCRAPRPAELVAMNSERSSDVLLRNALLFMLGLGAGVFVIILVLTHL